MLTLWLKTEVWLIIYMRKENYQIHNLEFHFHFYYKK